MAHISTDTKENVILIVKYLVNITNYIYTIDLF